MKINYIFLKYNSISLEDLLGGDTVHCDGVDQPIVTEFSHLYTQYRLDISIIRALGAWFRFIVKVLSPEYWTWTLTLELYHVSAIYAFPYLTLMKIYTNTCSHRESVLAAALGLLVGDELVPVHGHRRLALPPVSRLLVKLLPQPGISNIFVCTFIISILDT